MISGDEADPTADPAWRAELDERARAGVEHLQAAAREAIDGLRALLDVAEELVDDPATARSVAASIAGLVGTAIERIAPQQAPSDRPDDGTERVQRIPVS